MKYMRKNPGFDLEKMATDEPFTEFYSRYEEHCRFMGVPNGPPRLKLLMNALNDDMKRLLRDTVLKSKTADAIAKYLKKMTTANPGLLLRKIFTMKLKKEPFPLIKFVNRQYARIKEISPKASDDTNNAQVLGNLLRAIDDTKHLAEVFRRVERRGIDHYRDPTVLASEMDAYINPTFDPADHSKRKSRSRSRSQDDSLCNVDRNSNSRERRGRSDSRNRVYQDNRTLYDPKDGKTINVQQAMQSASGGSFYECNNCLEYGHYAANCPNEKRQRPRHDDIAGHIEHYKRNLALCLEKAKQGSKNM